MMCYSLIEIVHHYIKLAKTSIRFAYNFLNNIHIRRTTFANTYSYQMWQKRKVLLYFFVIVVHSYLNIDNKVGSLYINIIVATARSFGHASTVTKLPISGSFHAKEEHFNMLYLKYNAPAIYLMFLVK